MTGSAGAAELSARRELGARGDGQRVAEVAVEAPEHVCGPAVPLVVDDVQAYRVVPPWVRG
ncbi:hypothetical protein FHS23_004066 [Prauserella isguenensis]|uniref:Uncharacterized protein n=1 Tax=Prauserella isguenensis TaxID=1470180 RepID=A0A839S6Y7_9PSEU|nr:hypothetical protein [Prauserella isguenensis]MBB3053023.1 hypothetical protein [Prauserella isguenensis]